MGGKGSGGARVRQVAALTVQRHTVAQPSTERLAASEGAIEPPSWLSGMARESFTRHAERMVADRLITGRDSSSLVTVACAEAIIAALMSKDELTPADRAELRQWLGLYRLALGDLGSTPASRGRVDKIAPEDDEDDPLDQILRNRDFGVER